MNKKIKINKAFLIENIVFIAIAIIALSLCAFITTRALSLYQVSIDPIKNIGKKGQRIEYQVDVTNNSSEEITVDLTSSVPTGWAYEFDSDFLTIAENSTASMPFYLTSANGIENGIYHFDIDVRESGNLLATVRGDYIVFEPQAPQNEDIWQEAFEEKLNNGQETYDTELELFFSGETAGFGTAGEIASDYLGQIIADHDNEKIATKLYNSGLVGHLWSETSGWIILDSDGEPGSTNIDDDFGIVTNKKTVEKNGENIVINNLSGKAWAEGAGWIYFSCEDMVDVPQGAGACNVNELECVNRASLIENNFNVCIDENGKSHGHAWSENFGWIDFETIEINQPTFRVEISLSDINWSNPVVTEEVTGYSYTTPELEDGKTYFWRVCTKGDETCSDYSDIQEFTIKADPEVILITPSSGAVIANYTNEFNFTIKDKPGTTLSSILKIEKYNSDDDIWETFKEKTINSTIIDQNAVSSSVQITELTNGSYRWQIETSDDDDTPNKVDSYLREFTITTPTAEINCAYPADGETVYDRTPELALEITEPNNQDYKWRIKIDESNDFSSPEVETAYTTASENNVTHQVSSADSFATNNYKWKIEVLDSNDNLKTKTCNFTVANRAPTLDDEMIWIEGAGAIINNGSDTYDTTPVIKFEFTDDEQGNNFTAHAKIGEDSGLNFTDWEGLKENIGQGEYEFIVDTPLERGKAYFWQVVITDQDGESVNKQDAPWSFNLLEISDDGFGNIGTKNIRFPGTDEEKRLHRFAYNISEMLNDMSIGWVDFNPKGLGVYINETELLGYAWNQYLGKIRMNCKISGDMNNDGLIEINDEYICDVNDFAVKNSKRGELSGKAWLQDFGGYLYFNDQSYICDKFPAQCGFIPPSINVEKLQVNIMNDGGFAGYAWNDSIGWVDFNRYETISGDNAMINFFAVGEWIPDPNPPVASPENTQNYVFSAKRNQDTILLAIEEIDGDSGFYCPGGILDTNNENIDMELIYYDPDNSDEENKIQASDNKEYQIVCEDAIASCASDPDEDCYFKELRLDLSPTDGLLGTDISTQLGIYEIIGNVTDGAGNLLELPRHTIQVVAGAPDFTQTNTYVFTEPTDDPYANGEDYYRLLLDVRDEFGHPIVSETIQAGPGEGDPLKTVFVKANFLNTVDYDQYSKPEFDNGEPVEYDYIGANLEMRNGNYDEVTFDPDGNPIIFDVTSFAPTYYQETNDNSDNTLALANIEVVIINEPGFGEVGSCDNENDCKLMLNRSVDFKAMLAGELVDENGAPMEFENIIFNNDEDAIINFTVVNNDDGDESKTIEEADILAEMFAYDQNNGQDIASIVYNKTRLVDIDNDGNVTTVSYDGTEGASNPLPGYCHNDCVLQSYLEEASENYSFNNPFTFNGIESGIMSTELMNAPHSITWPYGTTNYFTLATEQSLLDEDAIAGMDIGTRMNIFVSYDNDGSEEVKHQLIIEEGAGSLIDRKISIEGLAAGENVVEDSISNPAKTRFIETGSISAFTDMSELIKRNVASATKGQKSLDDHIAGSSVTVNNWDDIFNPLPGQEKAEILENGKIAWFHGEDFTLNINGDLEIPNSKAYTIIVSGGNVNLKGNIVNGIGQKMTDGGNLGIIVLKTPTYLSNPSFNQDKSGNFLINPGVTNIKASIIAEGSIMSFDNAPFDEFRNDLDTKLNKQLFIKGTVMSRNTIGGSENTNVADEDDPKIPNYEFLWMPSECTYAEFAQDICSLEEKTKTATRFDLINLRKFSGNDADRALDIEDKFKFTSVVITYDEKIKNNTPPLFNLSEDLLFESKIN